jgi:hypothetical protein
MQAPQEQATSRLVGHREVACVASTEYAVQLTAGGRSVCQPVTW